MTMAIQKYVASIGRFFLILFENVGSVFLFFYNILRFGLQKKIYVRQILRQFMQIGYHSLPVVGMTAIFTGMVLALQSYTGFSRFSAEGAVATVVVLSVTRELGPVLAGLMLAGRVSAAIAAEIGTMRVTEQIDALVTLSVNPFRYLLFPRVLAGFLMMPLLVLVANTIGVFGGYLVAVYRLGFNESSYLNMTIKYLEIDDVVSGLIKAAVFGGIVTLMGCYHGYHSTRGAEGVGRATTNAVVSSSVMILTMNYILTSLLFEQ